MKFFANLLILSLVAAPVWAETPHGQHAHPSVVTEKISLVVDANDQFQAGKNIPLRLTLVAQDGTLLGGEDLKEVHTRKFHLLVIDNAMTDYHHLHPVEETKGRWVVDFTPRKNAPYHLWADITPATTGQQQYASFVLGQALAPEAQTNQHVVRQNKNGDDVFDLSFDGTPKVGQPLMAHVAVTRHGQPFAQLQPVMGAFAHMVGFANGGKTVMHVHPMGKEPTLDSERGGPTLVFHLVPLTAGYLKLFAQFKIDGKDVFIPFGLQVAE